jgi:tetratricopeptide (TPR) repeat protein
VPLDSVGGVFGGVALMAMGLMAVGACVWGLLGLLVMKEITATEFLIYAGVFIGLTIMGVLGGGPLGVAGLGVAAIAAVAFPLLRRWANSHALLQIEREDIRKYEATIKAHPEYSYPYKRLAEIYYQRGNWDVAAEWYEKYMEHTEDETIKFRIKRCMDLMAQAGEKVKFCTECLRRNPSGSRYCAGCGAILPGWWELIKPFRGRQGARLLLIVSVVSFAVSLVLGLVLQLHSILITLCFWWAAFALVYYIYKRVTLY